MARGMPCCTALRRHLLQDIGKALVAYVFCYGALCCVMLCGQGPAVQGSSESRMERNSVNPQGAYSARQAMNA